METYIDSMMNTTEGQKMYSDMLEEEHDLEDTTLLGDLANAYVYHYYAHQYFKLYMSDPCEVELDSNDLCYNNTFTLSDPSDDYLEGYNLFSGTFDGNIPGCSHDCDLLMNVPLPEGSYPSDPEYPFNLDPTDNNPLSGPYNQSLFNYHRIEMFEAGSGDDDIISLIPKSPPSGNRSIRLNRALRFKHTNTMERTIIVAPEDSVFRFSFALVLQDPRNHELDQKPYFIVLAIDNKGDIVDELCFISDSSDTRLEYGRFPGSSSPLTYRNWSCDSLDLSSHIGQEVTIRFVAAGCSLGAHFGYSYIADICEGCPPSLEPDECIGGCGPANICPPTFPIQFCFSFNNLDTSIYTIDSLYFEIRNDGDSYGFYEASSFDPGSLKVCFDITEDIYNSLPLQGYDVFAYADITHIANDHSTTIVSNSHNPNTIDDQNNDFFVRCCPELDITPASFSCVDTLVEFCGSILNDSCLYDITNLVLKVEHSDSTYLSLEISNYTDSTFCVELTDSILQSLPELCYSVSVCMTYWDEDLVEENTIESEYFHIGVPDEDCSLNLDCCPDIDLIDVSVSKMLCLVGNDHSNIVFDISGTILSSKIPEGFSYCDNELQFEGGYIDYLNINSTPAGILFNGLFHLTDTTQIQSDEEEALDFLIGSIILCGAQNNECEIGLRLFLQMGQGGMCLDMEGLMCANFVATTNPYNPPGMPLFHNDSVWMVMRLGLPFITKYESEHDSCEIDQYWVEVYGVDTSGTSSTLLMTQTVSQSGSETSGFFIGGLHLPISEWNSYSVINIEFWNNCGDTCRAKSIEVVPVLLIHDPSNPYFRSGEGEVKYYPVPFMNELTIEYKGLSRERTMVNIYSMAGQQIDRLELVGREGRMQISTGTWKSGTYIIEVIDDSLIQRSRTVIRE